MTDKELLELAAKAAGFEVIRPMDEAPLFNGRDWEPLLTLVELKRFAALVYAAGAAAEREKCAKKCESYIATEIGKEMADAIRAMSNE